MTLDELEAKLDAKTPEAQAIWMTLARAAQRGLTRGSVAESVPAYHRPHSRRPGKANSGSALLRILVLDRSMLRQAKAT
jgi:hypothetical protein